jgi:hypothetical protein
MQLKKACDSKRIFWIAKQASASLASLRTASQSPTITACGSYSRFDFEFKAVGREAGGSGT